MCVIGSIRMTNMILSYIKIVVAIYMFGVGIMFATTWQIHQGFGTKFIAYGVGLCFLGVFSGAITPLHKYAVEKHNRFLLLFCFFVDTFIFSFLIDTGMKINSVTYPLFPKDLQMDCLRMVPEKYSPDDCAAFFNSDRTAGFRLYWEGYYTDKVNTKSFQVLSDIQGKLCCGFFAPMSCIPNTDKFPSAYSQENIASEFLRQRVICGNMPTYYPQRDDCLDYYDQAAIPPIVGGCRYDLGVGFCLGKELKDTSIGCASYVEDYLSGIVGPNAVMLILLALFNFFAMLIACCMYWKRKEGDIFPAFSVEKENAIDYHEVKHQFELVPMDGILRKEGYITTEETAEGGESKMESSA